MDIVSGNFVLDTEKERLNIEKHGVDFTGAAAAFEDPGRQIYSDERHSFDENRLYCVGKVEEKVLTVRFTYRGDKIRIIGAGYWREGKDRYEKET